MITSSKRILTGTVLAALAAAITACSVPAATKPASTHDTNTKLVSDDKKTYVGFSLDTLEEERWYKDKFQFEDQIRKLGGDVKTLAANGNDEVQVKQAQLLIEEGADVLVVVPHNAVVSAQIVDIAHKSGVKVIAYDRLIKNSDLDYYISFDNEKVGEIQAAEVMKKAPEGNYVYIGGAETDNNAILYHQGAMKVLQPAIDSGSIHVIYDKYTDDWSPKVAEQNMKEALSQAHNKVSAVIAANDGTASGVIHALEAADLAGTIPVSGQDAEIDGIKRLIRGTQIMTVYKPINLIAQQAAELAMKVAKHEQVATDHSIDNGKIKVPSILLAPIPVTKETYKDTVIKDGFIDEKLLDE